MFKNTLLKREQNQQITTIRAKDPNNLLDFFFVLTHILYVWYSKWVDIFFGEWCWWPYFQVWFYSQKLLFLYKSIIFSWLEWIIKMNVVAHHKPAHIQNTITHLRVIMFTFGRRNMNNRNGYRKQVEYWEKWAMQVNESYRFW